MNTLTQQKVAVQPYIPIFFCVNFSQVLTNNISLYYCKAKKKKKKKDIERIKALGILAPVT